MGKKVEKTGGKRSKGKTVEALRHADEKRKNIPTAEYQSVVQEGAKSPIRIAYERLNRDLDPQLVWRGKDQQDWSDLVVHAPPLYIQEKVHPKVLVDDLMRQSRERRDAASQQPDLFAEFNGIPEGVDKTEFYRHEQNWSNRMILGDSLQVMASLAEREGLRGKVQCIYVDPPYGIKFNSNFQWSTTKPKVDPADRRDELTREPEQVRAFRDTWRDGIHSYLTYLRDRLTVARDLLTESGSIFVQIGDENVHRVRAMMDEVFGDENFVALITVEKTSAQTSEFLSMSTDYVLAFARSKEQLKFRALFGDKVPTESVMGEYAYIEDEQLRRSRMQGIDNADDWLKAESQFRIFCKDNTTSSRPPGSFPVSFRGTTYVPGNGYWKTGEEGFSRLIRANRLEPRGTSLRYVRFFRDYAVSPLHNIWRDVRFSSRREDKVYVVQSSIALIQRCLLMATDPGDLVLDPTCGSGTTAAAAELWGRRWITIDTSRVALALARARIMGARFPYFLLSDSPEGQTKEAEVTGKVPSSRPTSGNVRQGFVYERVPHVGLKSIANNVEIDVIWEKWQEALESLREKLNACVKQTWQEWEIPWEAGPNWPDKVKKLHAEWWKARIARQKEIDASIAAKADFEYLYDKPYLDTKKVRVAGPFTVESLSPHRVLGVDEDDELIDPVAETKGDYDGRKSFPEMILENLRAAGVQQAHMDARISFTALTPWPGDLVCADGRYREGEGATSVEKKAAIFIGPEFGTVNRPDLVEAAKEAGDAGFDVLIACAFNYDAHATEFSRLGRIPVLKARMNADLHMAEDLKSTGKGNLFVIFGEPDIDLLPASDGHLRVKVNGVDVFHPQTGEVRSDGADGIACWFVDTDYNEESFFVRHAYFLGANDPYDALKTTLKAEIDQDAWTTLHSDTSRPFPKPKSGRIAVKVINHLGDEVMKVFRVA
ncbi:MAG TPA: site-specific DNA-methyltransferase [Thermoanaerobaculia bacterium]|nr:site-specific DNA-methyltransferase [Thermoanaerobaculia bacterium]